MELARAIEKMEKHRVLICLTDGKRSERAEALGLLLDIARKKCYEECMKGVSEE